MLHATRVASVLAYFSFITNESSSLQKRHLVTTICNLSMYFFLLKYSCTHVIWRQIKKWLTSDTTKPVLIRVDSVEPRKHLYFKVWMISNTWNSAHVWDNWSTRRAPKRCWHLWNWKGRRRSHSTWTNSVSYFDMKLHHIFSSAIRVGVLHEPKLVYVCAACFSNRTSCRPLGKSSATEREKRLCRATLHSTCFGSL